MFSNVRLASGDLNVSLTSVGQHLSMLQECYSANKATIHRLTTMLSTSKNILFPGHNYLLTTGSDDPILQLSPKHQLTIGTDDPCIRWL